MSISKEIFGIEKEKLKIGCSCCSPFIDRRDAVIDEIDKFELSEEELAKIISNEWYDQLGKGLNRGQACELFAKAIKSNQSKLFVRKNK